MFAVFFLLLSWSILRERDEAVRRTESLALAGSQVVATNSRWITELARQALSRVDDALGPNVENNAAFTQALIRNAVADLPGNVKAYVVAADGRTLFSTDPNVRPIDIRDREYFRALADGEAWFISGVLISRLDDAQIFVLSKRIERDGRFVGAAMISFDVVLFRDVWTSLAMDDHSAVSLVRGDGVLIARYPLAAAPLDLGDQPLFTQHLPEGPVGTYRAVSGADGVERIVGYRRIDGTALVALAAISTEGAFASFRRNMLLTLGFALPTALLLAGTAFWILRLLRRAQLRNAALEEALSLNRLLIKDTHHRVKNNLQAIMSMVRMHPLPRELKADLQHRIAAMSAVHEHLYRLDDYAEIRASTLIPAIVDLLRDGVDTNAEIACAADPIVLDRDQATPLALLVSEVVTNALKYAFPDGRDGTISVTLTDRGDGSASFVVADDGVGFDRSAASTGLGSRIITAMVQQLDGSASWDTSAGTRFETVFPIRPASERPDAAARANALRAA